MRKVILSICRYLVCLEILAGLIHVSVHGQGEVAVMSGLFKVITADSNYRVLEKKMPGLICNGILYKSDLNLISEPRQEMFFSRYFTTNLQEQLTDTARLKGYRRSLDSLRAEYFMNGEIGISNQEFYININATDFRSGIISYKTGKYYPLSEFQKVVDEASETISRQMHIRHSGDKIKKIMIENFYINFEKKSYGRHTIDNIYAPDFVSRYLAYNIKNTKDVAILPYYATEQLELYTNFEKATLLKPDFVIAGKISFGSNDTCRIQPIIYDNHSDSLVLETIQGGTENKDELLNRTIAEIQAFVDNIDVTSTSLSQLKLLLLKGGDYQKAFDSARLSGRYDLALYYADYLPDKKDLLKGEVFYERGNYNEAFYALASYLKIDSLNPETNYYLALTYIKKGRYQLAKECLSLLDAVEYPVGDLHYLKGICFYYEDSTAAALSEFEIQTQVDETLHPDMYAYVGSLYKNKGDLKRAEENYLVLYNKDTGNIMYKKYLSEFYAEVAKIKMTGKDYAKAGEYYKKAYQYEHTEETLFGAIESSILQRNEDSVHAVVLLAAGDTLTDLSSLYVEVSAYCRLRQDENTDFSPLLTRLSVFFLTQYLKTPNSSLEQVAHDLGSDYFRLKILDSADYFYKIALKFNPDVPINYFNLAELQIMESTLAVASTTLDRARQRFHLDSIDLKGKYIVGNETYCALFLVYSSQCGIFMRKDTRPLEARLKSIINHFKTNNKQNILFYNWSFSTYHSWLVDNAKLDDYTRKKLLENLCIVTPYSQDNKISCDF